MTTTDVYRDRIKRAQAALKSAGVDLLFIGPGPDLVYLTGINAHLSERLNLLLLPVEGTPSFVIPRLEAPNVAAKADLVEIHAWEETESAVGASREAGRVSEVRRGRGSAPRDLPAEAARGCAVRNMDTGRTGAPRLADAKGCC